ncbi:MAG: ABC transporter ATP-binding protein [Eubacteriales bacterium]|nr:ABC transporter ATP-binding protein [Eubacteriales bacterium]
MSRLLEVNHLSKFYTNKKGFFGGAPETVKAVSDISFYVDEQETLGIVGESGCGKSTTGRAVLRLHEPTSGEVRFRGQDILALSEEEMRPYRQKMQIVFQNANSALDPRWTVEKSIAEPILLHNPGISRSELDDRIDTLMKEVGFSPMYKKKYPHEFSGGQRQRIGIAKAISVSPEFVVCDEPVSALDVSVQAQVLNLMKRLKAERKLSYMFISHDLSVIRFISDRVGVMYAGRLVELAETREFFENAMHPYSRVLMAAVPKPVVVEDKAALYQGIGKISEVSKEGCPFCSRCPAAKDVCRQQLPSQKEVSPGHMVMCHLY